MTQSETNSEAKSKLVDQLLAIVGEKGLFTDEDSLARYGLDWTRFYTPDARALVKPACTEELQQLVLLANELNLALVPSGGRTGLSGGAVALAGEVVVSLERMNGIGEFNETDQTVKVQAGVITAQLQAFATSVGLQYPVDFASSGSSQIGGNIATNAGGIKVVRYGLTRDWVAGLTVVTGRGDILHLNRGLVKNATGYDLRHLFIGSEGTLGFITEAEIRLTAPQVNPEVLLLAVPRMTDIVSVLKVFRANVVLSAFEFFSEAALQFVLERDASPHPFETSSEYYTLIEFDCSSTDSVDQAMAAFEDCVAAGWVTDGVKSESDAQREKLWSYREHISEAITPRTPYKNDISVRVSHVPGFLAEVETLVNTEYPDFEIIWFGHIGDGNLHLNILRPTDMPVVEFKRHCEVVSELVLGIVQRFEGSISAEHGVGLLKRDQLHFSRSPEEISLLRLIKQAFDPNGIMNPGKLIPL